MTVSLAVGLALGASCLFSPALGLPRGRRGIVLTALSLFVLLTPLLVEAERRFARFLAAVLAVALTAKMIDLHRGAELGHRPAFGSVFTFLINLCSLVRRKLGDEPRPSSLANLRRLAAMSLLSVPGLCLLVACDRVEWRGLPFLLEHSAKVFALFSLLVPAGGAGAAFWRLLGGWTREPMDNPFASTTPADFWRRYNRPAEQFFLEDVYRPLGGRRRPIRGALATFAVSGLFHEYLFDISVGRIQGYQMAFFLIQASGVILSPRGPLRGWRRAVGIAATLGFNLVTSILFFANLDEVIPFYERR